MYRHLIFIIFFGLSVSELSGQVDTLLTDSIDELLISATKIPTENTNYPSSLSVIDLDALQIKQQLSLQEYTRTVPGLFTLNANNFAQDLRISIRGFGSRAAFGIRGIKLIVDGVPETTPDGQGQLDNLDLGIINSIEILRGPSSSLYGNASGGVININTIDHIEQSYTQAGISFGSYGMQQYQLSKGIKSEKTTALLHGSYMKSNGYRVQSGFQNLNLNAKINHQLDDKSSLKFGFTYSNSPQADDPGGINLETAETDREQARDRNVSFETGEEIKQIKGSIRYGLELTESMDLSSYAFFATRDFYGKLPFGFGGIVDLSRAYGGHGSSLTLQQVNASSVNKIQFGYDLAIQRDNRERFFNNEGTQGDLTFDQKESFFNAGLYVLDHFQTGKFFLSGGLRWDINRLSAADNFLTNGDNSGSINLSSINPSLGVSYQISNSNYLFANVATSFETPTLSELSNNPDGTEGLNPELKPQRSRNIEIGVKGNLNTSTESEISYSLAVFNIATTNDLVPYELEAFPDRDFFRNAGETSRIGLEGNVGYSFGGGWKSNLSFTYSDFEYTSYELGSNDFAGNALPGIPKTFGTLSLTKSAEKGLLVDAQLIHTGELYANDKNDVTVPGYTMLNLNMGYLTDTSGVRLTPYLGINNLLSTAYFDNVRINAFGGRYYEPAPLRNFYAGLKINF